MAYRRFKRADDVVDLGEDRVLAVDHGVRRRPLLGKVHHRLGLEFGHHRRQKLVVRNVADKRLDLLARELLPDGKPLGERADRGQGLRPEFVVPLTAGEVIDDRDRVSLVGQIQRRRPSAVAVAA